MGWLTSKRQRTITDDPLELIGNTPMIPIRRVNDGQSTIFVKLESSNPCSSVKDRIGAAMILDAEKAGKLTPGVSTIVEVSHILCPFLYSLLVSF